MSRGTGFGSETKVGFERYDLPGTPTSSISRPRSISGTKTPGRDFGMGKERENEEKRKIKKKMMG